MQSRTDRKGVEAAAAERAVIARRSMQDRVAIARIRHHLRVFLERLIRFRRSGVKPAARGLSPRDGERRLDEPGAFAGRARVHRRRRLAWALGMSVYAVAGAAVASTYPCHRYVNAYNTTTISQTESRELVMVAGEQDGYVLWENPHDTTVRYYVRCELNNSNYNGTSCTVTYDTFHGTESTWTFASDMQSPKLDTGIIKVGAGGQIRVDISLPKPIEPAHTSDLEIRLESLYAMEPRIVPATDAATEGTSTTSQLYVYNVCQ